MRPPDIEWSQGTEVRHETSRGNFLALGNLDSRARLRPRSFFFTRSLRKLERQNHESRRLVEMLFVDVLSQFVVILIERLFFSASRHLQSGLSAMLQHMLDESPSDSSLAT